MGIPVLIMGESGSGKSASLRNFEPGEIGILNVASKPLPFRKKLPKVDNAGYQKIEKALANPSLKAYAIDDSQYLMAFEMFAKAKETGYGKFTDCAKRFYDLIQTVIRKTPDDCIVYFVKIYRQIIKWGWYRDIPVKVLFLHCLFMANYQEAKWYGVTVGRGSFITSIYFSYKEQLCTHTTTQSRKE